ncbi:hypothetical protein ACOMHN_055513 [Nucella lapillus]
MLMMRARVQGHRWVDHPAAAVMEARVLGQWVDRPAAMVMEAREQGRCWIDHPAAAVMEARVQGRHWVDCPSVGGGGKVFLIKTGAACVMYVWSLKKEMMCSFESTAVFMKKRCVVSVLDNRTSVFGGTRQCPGSDRCCPGNYS